jgi:transposase-like protein
MTANLQNPIFTDETKAREWLEARVWPHGPVCPHCGSTGSDVTALNGKAHRPGLYQCAGCREQFTVTVKTVFERSKIPLSKWLAALFLLTASKKGVSAHQVHRSLQISYKSAWFMMHRLREALRTGGLAPMGGSGKVVEADETYFGKTEEQANVTTREGRPFKSPRQIGGVNKRAILALVERGGSARTSILPAPTSIQCTASCATTLPAKPKSTQTKAASTTSLSGALRNTKRSSIRPMSMFAAMCTRILLKATSQCLSAE